VFQIVDISEQILEQYIKKYLVCQEKYTTIYCDIDENTN